jgi:hypothetical protein
MKWDVAFRMLDRPEEETLWSHHTQPLKLPVSLNFTIAVIIVHMKLLFKLTMSLKMTVFWDVEPCSLVEIYQSFRGA